VKAVSSVKAVNDLEAFSLYPVAAQWLKYSPGTSKTGLRLLRIFEKSYLKHRAAYIEEL